MDQMPISNPQKKPEFQPAESGPQAPESQTPETAQQGERNLPPTTPSQVKPTDPIAATSDVNALRNNILNTPTVQGAPAGQTVQNTSDPEDLIKEAQAIIEKDKDDPYREEEDHEKIQIQYLKTRFGKDIKKSE